MSLRVKVNLPESELPFNAKLIRMRFEVFLQFGISWISLGGDALGDKLQLLTQTPSDDCIFLIKPERPCFTRADFLMYVVAN